MNFSKSVQRILIKVYCKYCFWIIILALYSHTNLYFGAIGMSKCSWIHLNSLVNLYEAWSDPNYCLKPKLCKQYVSDVKDLNISKWTLIICNVASISINLLFLSPSIDGTHLKQICVFTFLYVKRCVFFFFNKRLSLYLITKSFS